MELSMNMTERLSKLIALIVLVISIGCENRVEKSIAYFGGKIINPKTDYVILFDHESAIDTFYLNQNNVFLGEISPLYEGLYYFKHSNEYQYVYLKPKDSVLVRLNTWDFDESLVFSGKGALRNNLLIDCFLDAEKDRRLFYSYYELPAQSFISKVDSLEKIKINRYKDFIRKNPQESEKFLNILSIALTYPLYGHVENYPLLHKMKHNTNYFDEVGGDFYKHRKKIKTDQDSIMYYSAYRNFMVNHIYNKVYGYGHQEETDEFAVDLLKTISNVIKNERFKNRMLRQAILGHFYNQSSCKYNPQTFETFLSLSSSKEDKRLVNRLINDTKKIHSGKKLEDFHVTDYNNTDRSIKSLTKYKNSFVYFWNPKYYSKEHVSKRVQFLSNKFPDINFIGVKIDGKGRLKTIDIKSQYYLNPQSEANKFLTSRMPRALIINKKGILVNGYASLVSNDIFDQLKELSKN